MRTMLAVALLAVLAAGLAAQDKQKYEKDGKFTAKFPTEAKAVTKTAGGLTLHAVLAESTKGKSGYLVTYSDLPPETLKAPKPEQVLESSEKGLVENFRAKITKSEAIKFGTKQYPAREITAERTDFHLHGKIILVGNRLYQVYVFGSKEFTTNKEAEAFLMSFAITD
jgi:hypothetical protein